LKLEMVAAKKFAHAIVRPIDRLTVFQLSETVQQRTVFTSDLKTIDRGIDSLVPGAGTSVYDAIYLGAEALLNRRGRKILVLISDGGDTTSETDYSHALRGAQESEAIVYSIIVVP